jgi:hypothetical protein
MPIEARAPRSASLLRPSMVSATDPFHAAFPPSRFLNTKSNLNSIKNKGEKCHAVPGIGQARLRSGEVSYSATSYARDIKRALTKDGMVAVSPASRSADKPGGTSKRQEREHLFALVSLSRTTCRTR